MFIRHEYNFDNRKSRLLDRITQMVERQAGDLEVQGSNPGPGSNFSLDI